MSEQQKPYSLEEAENEAEKLRGSVESGKSRDYAEADKWLTILNSLNGYILEYEKEISEDPRHPIQQEVFRALRDFVEQGYKEGYVKLPTGTGKTVLFKRFAESIGVRSLIVVPKNILVEQTLGTLSGSTLANDVGVVNI